MTDNKFSNRAPAKGFKYVRVVDYATYDENGKLVGLSCKLCGTVMGEVVAKVINRNVQNDGRIVEQVETRFRRNQNYAELLIETTDGGRHGTCVCKKCSAGTLKPAILAELIRADAIEQRWPEDALERQLRRVPKAATRLDMQKVLRAE